MEPNTSTNSINQLEAQSVVSPSATVATPNTAPLESVSGAGSNSFRSLIDQPENNLRKGVILALAIALVVVGGYFLVKVLIIDRANELKNIGPAEGIELSLADLSDGSANKLPSGLPSGVPVEQENVTDSYTALYTQYGISQHTVIYSSNKDADDIRTEYQNYLNSEGYTIDNTGNVEEQGLMRGVRDGVELNVLIISRDTQNYVTLNYIVKQ